MSARGPAPPGVEAQRLQELEKEVRELGGGGAIRRGASTFLPWRNVSAHRADPWPRQGPERGSSGPAPDLHRPDLVGLRDRPRPLDSRRLVRVLVAQRSPPGPVAPAASSAGPPAAARGTDNAVGAPGQAIRRRKHRDGGDLEGPAPPRWPVPVHRPRRTTRRRGHRSHRPEPWAPPTQAPPPRPRGKSLQARGPLWRDGPWKDRDDPRDRHRPVGEPVPTAPDPTAPTPTTSHPPPPNTATIATTPPPPPRHPPRHNQPSTKPRTIQWAAARVRSAGGSLLRKARWRRTADGADDLTAEC